MFCFRMAVCRCPGLFDQRILGIRELRAAIRRITLRSRYVRLLAVVNVPVAASDGRRHISAVRSTQFDGHTNQVYKYRVRNKSCN